MKNQVFRIWKQCLSLCFVHLFILSNKQVQRGGKSNQSLIQSRKREKSSRSKIYLGGRQGGDRATDNLKVRRRWKTQENSIMVTDHRMKGLLPQDIRGKRKLYCEYWENKMAGWSFATHDSSPISGLCEKLQALLLLRYFNTPSSIQDTQSDAALISSAIVCFSLIHLLGFQLLCRKILVQTWKLLNWE